VPELTQRPAAAARFWLSTLDSCLSTIVLRVRNQQFAQLLLDNINSLLVRCDDRQFVCRFAPRAIDDDRFYVVASRLLCQFARRLHAQHAAPHQQQRQHVAHIAAIRLLAQLVKQFQQHLVGRQFDFLGGRLWDPRFPPTNGIVRRSVPGLGAKVFAHNLRPLGLQDGEASFAVFQWPIGGRAATRTPLNFEIEQHA
jgi:hypothetical protein